MKYQNYKLWLTLDLESVDYKRISAFLHSKLLEEYKFNAKKNTANYLTTDDIGSVLNFEHIINSNLANSILFFLQYKDDFIKESYNAEAVIENIKIMYPYKSNIIFKDYFKNIPKETLSSKTSINEDNKITIGYLLNGNISNKADEMLINIDEVINSEDELSLKFTRPIKVKIKKSDSIESKSKLNFTVLIKENNTIGRLKDYTLESLANRNLYYLGYIQLY